MNEKNPGPARRLGNFLVVLGTVALLIVGSALAYRSWQRQQVLSRLAQATAIPTATLPPATPTPTPSPTTEPPTTVVSAGTAVPAPTELPGAGAQVATPPTPFGLKETPSATPTVEAAGLATPQPAIASPTPTATAGPPAITRPTTSPVAPVRLVIPRLGMDVPVAEMGWGIVETAEGPRSEWVIPDNEAGHHLNSAALGEGGNVVISGHNNLGAAVFRPISVSFDPQQPNAFVGYQVQVYGADGRVFHYAIERVYFFDEANATYEQRLEHARLMDPTDEDQLTLITCWPAWSNTHRIVLIARPASAP